MRRMPVILATLASASASVWATGAGLPPALVAAGEDVTHARTVVPDPARAVGEVRLVSRGAATVVQTVLVTKVLRRAVSEIAQKERANWAAGQAGSDDMERYVAAVQAAAVDLEIARDAAEGGDRRLRLIIEFVAGAEAAGVVLATFTGPDGEAGGETPGRRVLETRAMGRRYVLRNMRLILADAFGRPEADVGSLGPLGPAAVP